MTTATRIEGAWTPRELGNGVYCSPACGHRCTREQYDHAMRQAAALADLLGPGWRPHVWENCGWYWRAVKGATQFHAGLAEVHPLHDQPRPGQSEQQWQAWINPATEGVSQVITDWLSDPIEALGIALQEARTRALRFDGELNSISSEEG